MHAERFSRKEGNRDESVRIWNRRGIHCNATGLRDPFGNKHSKGIKCIQRHRYNRGIDNGF